MPQRRVIIIGGGVGGLSAAHELIERGYEVIVIEGRTSVGGKARTQPVMGTGTSGRRDLPGEHGFRFYPRFYTHLIDTMCRIPDPTRFQGTVEQNLRATTEAGIALSDKENLHRFLRRRLTTPVQIVEAIELFFQKLGLDYGDIQMFSLKVLEFFTSCDERRLQEYESMSWWEFLQGDKYSHKFQKYLCAIPRTMVAMDARKGSARTIGNISMQLFLDYASEGDKNDRTLGGPTSEKWLDHWYAYLKSQGVIFHLGTSVEKIVFNGRKITGVKLAGDPNPLVGDWYVGAVPLEIMHRLVTPEMGKVDPQLENLRTLNIAWMTSWMVGLQLFLYEDVPMVKGHVFYPDSPWAITSISQAQFWSDNGLFRQQYGNGEVGGIISIDISDWDTPGTFISKPAKLCTPEEIKTEIWEQLKVALNSPNKVILEDSNLWGWHLDDDLLYDKTLPPKNSNQLLVHPPGSWRLRPKTATAIPNLVLAADYVKTYTDLASMEGANEAARRATNVILKRDNYAGKYAELWPLQEPELFNLAKQVDRILLSRGQKHLFQLLGIDNLFSGISLLRKLNNQLIEFFASDNFFLSVIRNLIF